MANVKKDKNTDEKPEAVSASGQLEAFLKSNKDDHFNFEEDIYYKVSSGSLNLDIEVGGFTPGLHRLVGPASSGKTSSALEVVRNFFLEVPNSRAIHVKTEGRLSPEIMERSGLKFVHSAEEWKNGTVFVFECNIYDTIIDLMRQLISKSNNTENIRYAFIIDSADGLVLKQDLEKGYGEERVAGAPMLTKKFLQRMAIGLAKFGHICFFLSQISTEIKLDPYVKNIPRQSIGSGGRALEHWANLVLEYQSRFQSDLILEKPTEKPDRITNRILGHFCKVQVKKSDNEKNFVTVSIPIHYGQKAGKSVWREYEILDTLSMFQLLDKKGAWFSLDPTLQAELKAVNLEVPEKFQGVNNLRTFLAENEKVTNFLFEKFKKIMS